MSTVRSAAMESSRAARAPSMSVAVVQHLPSAALPWTRSDRRSPTNAEISRLDECRMPSKDRATDDHHRRTSPDATGGDDSRKRFACPECGKLFGRLSHVRRHQLLHTGDKPFACDVCGDRFTRLENRDRHRIVHTKHRPYNCDECGKGFTQLNRLKVHRLTHTGERPFICETCGKRFLRVDHLKVHMRTHRPPPAKAQCPEAETTADVAVDEPPQSQPLPLLVRADADEQIHGPDDEERIDKPFLCAECPKRFARRDHLIRHALVHTGAKPFACELCERKFSRNDNRYSHTIGCLQKLYGVSLDVGSSWSSAGDESPATGSSSTMQRKVDECVRLVLSGAYRAPGTPAGDLHIDHDVTHDSPTPADRCSDDEPPKNATNEQLHAFDYSSGASNYCSIEMAASPARSGSPAIEARTPTPDGEQQAHAFDYTNAAMRSGSHSPYAQPSDSATFNECSDSGHDSPPQIGRQPPASDYADAGAVRQHPAVPLLKVRDITELAAVPAAIGVAALPTSADQRQPIERTFRCEHCPKTFQNKSHLVRHAALHVSPRPFACDQCDKAFNRKEHLQRHVIVHTRIKPFRCPFCDRAFVEQNLQRRHLNEEHGAEVAAAAAARRTAARDATGGDADDSSDDAPVDAAGTSTDGRPFQCDFCEQTFARAEYKRRHMAIHSSEKRYECEFCERRFVRADHMLAHVKTHEGVLPYKCAVCAQRFATSKEKMLHNRRHTGAYRCEMCLERFESFAELTDHRRDIHLVEPAAVADAPRQSHEPLAEIVVQRAEAGPPDNDDRPFGCDICGVRFMRAEHQRRHIAIHTNETRYQCVHCDRRFFRADRLRAHERSHKADEWPVAVPAAADNRTDALRCARCPQTFADAAARAEHVRFAHADAFRCESCLERFETLADLAEHRRDIHLHADTERVEILVGRQEHYPCPVCKEYFSIVRLGDHLKTHVADGDASTNGQPMAVPDGGRPQQVYADGMAYGWKDAQRNVVVPMELDALNAPPMWFKAEHDLAN